jgi:hypothetical protein
MKILIPILATAIVSCTNTINPTKTFDRSLFIARDHTAENLFSTNIEGPAQLALSTPMELLICLLPCLKEVLATAYSLMQQGICW